MEAEEPRGAAIFRACAAMHGIALTNPNAALGTEDRCRDSLRQAGFESIRTVTERVPFGEQDRAVAWESNLKSPAHKQVLALDPNRLEEMRIAYEETMDREAGKSSTGRPPRGRGVKPGPASTPKGASSIGVARSRLQAAQT